MARPPRGNEVLFRAQQELSRDLPGFLDPVKSWKWLLVGVFWGGAARRLPATALRACRGCKQRDAPTSLFFLVPRRPLAPHRQGSNECAQCYT